MFNIYYKMTHTHAQIKNNSIDEFKFNLHIQAVIYLKGVSLSRIFKKSIFFFFVSIDELLSENIVAKFYSPYRNSFDGRVPSSDSRGASERYV